MRKHLAQAGLIGFDNEPCLYLDQKKGILVHTHVDDLTVAIDENDMEEFLKKIGDGLTLSHAEASKVVGLEIKQEAKSTTIKQKQAILQLWEEFKTEPLVNGKRGHSKSPHEPKETNTHQEEEKVQLNQQEHHKYRSVVGSMQYIASCTRPDISFALHRLSTKLVKPTQADWRRAMRVLDYLAGTSEYGLTYKDTGNRTPLAYSDSDWGKDTEDRKSVSGVCIFYAGAPVSWTVKKQPVVAQSTTESELIAANVAGKDLEFFRSLLEQLKDLLAEPSMLNIDNTGTLALVGKPIINRGTRHIGVRFFHLRHLQEQGIVQTKYIASNENIADILTKPLGRQPQEAFCKQLFAA